ncbi:hypothetical protein C4F40_11510 [Sphingobacterium sp. Ka21]|uniref:Cyanophycin synthase-like N-terminal domain-containing protein n=2 Tax=Sphingobacterium pedocola TaxID=2082722 RepID=A0ABR9T7L9_9SPHI|nr:hypothetical protein [Sphingobacterium pedocola]
MKMIQLSVIPQSQMPLENNEKTLENKEKFIRMEIDLGLFEAYPTSRLLGFVSKLITLLPSLQDHGPAEGSTDNLVARMHRGIWLGEVIEHVAQELQSLAGMPCRFGMTRTGANPGVYFIVYSFANVHAGVYAGLIAFELVKALADDGTFDIRTAIQKLVGFRFHDEDNTFKRAVVNVAYTSEEWWQAN